MSSEMNAGKVLFGKTQQALLALFFVNPNQSYYLRQITRIANVGVGSVQRELARWTKAGLLLRTKQGIQVNYSANKKSPVFAELQALVIKTVGIADCIKEALYSQKSKITQAYIYGSFARGTQTRVSDIDLMLIGTLSFKEAVELLSDAQATLGREINPTVYDKTDYEERLKAEDHFLSSLNREPKIWLIGGPDEPD